MPEPAQVERAIRLSYIQVMLTAVFTASTGGMFLVGFAIELGANDVLLGVMAGVPQFMVALQFLAAYFVERGVSRKRMAVFFALLSPLCWFLVGAIVASARVTTPLQRVAMLAGIIALVAFSGQLASNARSSWLGELIPAERRGRFFGRCTLFSGIVGSVFAIIEGRFLDIIRSYGLLAFAGLFFFGALFGVASGALHIPQPDCPLPGSGQRPPFLRLVRDALRNRSLMLLTVVTCVASMSGIAGPFVSAYALRDVGLSFFGLGILNSITTAALLLSAPMWGSVVDRHGCRPVLILGLLLTAPTALVWLFIPPKSPQMAYLLLPAANMVAGLGSAATGIAIMSMIYKVARPEGRSVQFATFNVLVTLCAAPMPVLGGWLVSHLQSAGVGADLRLTFYLSGAFLLVAAAIARFLHEPESMRTRTLVFAYLPSRVARMWGSAFSVYTISAWLVRSWQKVRGTGRRNKPQGGP